MTNLPNLDPATANAAYMELRDCVPWLFSDDSADMLERRRHALARIDHLRPANDMEASFAAQVVALDLHRQDSLRLAAEHRDDATTAVRCRNSATALSRQALRIEAKLEAMQQARRLGSGARDFMEKWLARADQAASMPDQPERRAPEAAPPDAGTPPPPPEAPDPAVPEAADTDPDARIAAAMSPQVLAKAEQYAAANRTLAMRIRRAGGLTRQAVAGFRPSAYPQDDETLQALVFGRSPALLALDGADAQRKAA